MSLPAHPRLVLLLAVVMLVVGLVGDVLEDAATVRTGAVVVVVVALATIVIVLPALAARSQDDE